MRRRSRRYRNTAICTNHRWTPSSGSAENATSRSVPVTAGDAFAWGEPQRLFSLENYRSPDTGRMWDVTPRDRRFLMLRIVPGEVPTELIVVENFFEGLQATVKR
jgi:hypothetical protein